MFSHVMIGTSDIDRARHFYDKVLGLLGAGAPAEVERPDGKKALFYRHKGNVFAVAQPRNGEPATPANGGTIGFTCDSPEQVRQFHDLIVSLGGQSIEDPPGLRESSVMGPMVLAYARDLDGNKLCALYRPKEQKS